MSHAAELRGEKNGGDDISAGGDDDGVGLNERSPTLMLGLVTGKQGNQSLLYGGILGRWWSPAGDLIQIAYNGIVETADGMVFGHWLVFIKGSGLQGICHHIGKGTRSLLKVGKAVNSQQPVRVDSITIEPLVTIPQ